MDAIKIYDVTKEEQDHIVVELKEITWENYEKVLALKVAKNQENFLSSNAESLAEAYLDSKEEKSSYVPLAIVSGDEVVGFLMYVYCDPQGAEGYRQQEPYFRLFRFMIGEAHQGKGYGRSALAKLLEHMKTRPHGPTNNIFTCYEKSNVVVRKLYASLGFVEVGIDEDGDIDARLDI